MRVATALPHSVRVIENIFIPMTDGQRLAAKVWMPEDAERTPVPVIMEYIPYRKRDSARRDELTHPYFAGHGYASVRVDCRGSGDSDGVMHDEYLQQEQDDGVEVIAWLARQPWCTGKRRHDRHLLGRLQRPAGRGPPAAGAQGHRHRSCSTDDRYADDMHFMGGCHAQRQLSLGTAMFFAHRPRPPDPAIVGERWRDDVAGSGWRPASPGIADWLRAPAPRRLLEARLGLRGLRRHQVRRSMPSAAGPTAIPTPCSALLRDLKAPRKGMIGPWAHKYPAFRRTRPGDRLPAGIAALVGPLAEGHRHRHHGRADAARLWCRTACRRQPTTTSAPAAG